MPLGWEAQAMCLFSLWVRPALGKCLCNAISCIHCFSPEVNATLTSQPLFSISRSGRRCWPTMLLPVSSPVLLVIKPCPFFASIYCSLGAPFRFHGILLLSIVRLCFLQSSRLVSGHATWYSGGPCAWFNVAILKFVMIFKQWCWIFILHWDYPHM